MARLATVSNGTTSKPPDGTGQTERPRADRSTAKGRALADAPRARPPRSSESQLPPGIRSQQDMTVRKEGPPSRDFDLEGHYRYLFERARSFWETEALCARAERDYRREVFGNRLPFNEPPSAKDARILEDYCGLPPWEVATWEDCDPESVRRLRRAAFLNPEDGMEVELDERTMRILELAAKSMSQRATAAEVGVSAMTVSRTLAGVS